MAYRWVAVIIALYIFFCHLDFTGKTKPDPGADFWKRVFMWVVSAGVAVLASVKILKHNIPRPFRMLDIFVILFFLVILGISALLARYDKPTKEVVYIREDYSPQWIFYLALVGYIYLKGTRW